MCCDDVTGSDKFGLLIASTVISSAAELLQLKLFLVLFAITVLLLLLVSMSNDVNDKLFDARGPIS